LQNIAAIVAVWHGGNMLILIVEVTLS